MKIISKINTFLKKEINIYNKVFPKKFEQNNNILLLDKYIKNNNLWEKAFSDFLIRILIFILYVFGIFILPDIFEKSDSDAIIFITFFLILFLNIGLNTCRNSRRSVKNKKLDIEDLNNITKEKILTNLNFSLNSKIKNYDSVFGQYILPILLTILFELNKITTELQINNYSFFIVSMIYLVFIIYLFRQIYFSYISITNPYSEEYLDSFNNIILNYYNINM